MELSEDKIAKLGSMFSATSPIVVQKKLAGKSGAGVWLVDAQLPNWSGTGILKIERSNGIVGRSPEATAHALAARVNEQFGKEHIAALIQHHETSKEQISLFSTVGGGLENCRSLKSLPSAIHKAACESVTEDLLKVWNESATEAESLWSESQVMQAWLQYRLYANNGGRIPERLNAFGVDASDQSFSYAGVIYPNPLYYALDDNLNVLGGIRPILGHCHNDLHGDNVLVTEALGTRICYFLIDFALACGDEPLLYDQAYLELSSLLATCDKLSINSWIDEITKLNNVNGIQDLYSQQVDKHRIPNAESIAGIRHICKSWARTKYGPRCAQVSRQQMLARVAVGLNFFNKFGIEKETELKALLYASIALRGYFEYCNLPIPDSERILRDPAIIPGITSEEIRNACHFLDSFERGRNLYLLVSTLEPGELLNVVASVVSRPHWALIVDLSDESDKGSFYESVSPQIGKVAVVRVDLADKDSQTISTTRSTTWLKARGWNKVVGSVMPDVMTWRRKKLNSVRLVIGKVFESLYPTSVRVVVLQGNSSSEYTAAICEALYETAGIDDFRLLWMGPHISSAQIPMESVLHFGDKPVERLQAIIDLSLGKALDAMALWLPCRKYGDSCAELKNFTDSREVGIISEHMQLVHSGLADPDAEPLEGGFLKGAPISWAELDLEQDLERDVYPSTEENLMRALSDPRNKMFEIVHKPGAGGSTLARRLLWNKRSDHPTAILRCITPLTASRIEILFQLTSLPVLLLAEADVCTREDVVRLLHATSSRNVRCCVLFVSRLTGATPSHPVTEAHTFVSDVMPPSEARKFLGRYSIGASARQLGKLKELASSATLQRFRSPFFFGLYRFEQEFVHVADYVRAQLHDLDDRQRRLLAYVSLVSVYTQGGLPEKMLAKLSDQPYLPGAMIGRIFGHDVDRLLVSYERDESLVKASHPLLGQQSLEILIGTGKSTNEDAWCAQLSILSQRLIEEVCSHPEQASPQHNSELLMQLFIQRDHISADSEKKNLFSPLLTEIGNEAYRAQILQLLTTALPHEPHFWNHFARHCMYSEGRRFNDAINYLNLAINLAPTDELHQHTLGMAYSLRARGMLMEYKRGSAQHVDAWHAVREDYKLARECFQLARGLSGNVSQYPFVSDIQLVTRTVSSLRAISGANSFFDFLVEETTISDRLRDELSSANDLLAELKQLTDETADHPEYVAEVDFYLKKIEKSPENLMTYVGKRINEPGGNTLQNRRFLLSLSQEQRRNGIKYNSPEVVERYLRIAERNLDSALPTDQDFRHWLSIYRESDQFNMIEAIDKVTRWHQLTRSIDSAFYLYALNFAQWYDGAITNVDVVRSSMERCISLSQERSRRRSIEYLALSQSGIGLISAENLGERDSSTGFFVGANQLASADGIIQEIRGPQSGTISVIPLWAKTDGMTKSSSNAISAFFVPGEDFHAAADEATAVQFFLGFRRGGLRAHVVKRTINS